jgi:hypothetical protein
MSRCYKSLIMLLCLGQGPPGLTIDIVKFVSLLSIAFIYFCHVNVCEFLYYADIFYQLSTFQLLQTTQIYTYYTVQHIIVKMMPRCYMHLIR